MKYYTILFKDKNIKTLNKEEFNRTVQKSFNDTTQSNIEYRDALERLMTNEDFKLVILEGFLERFPLVKLREQVTTLLNDSVLSMTKEQGRAPVHLADYFDRIRSNGLDSDNIIRQQNIDKGV